jgi:hypothetical protein
MEGFMARRIHNPGNTLVEYGICIGLVVVLAGVSLKLLGGTIFELLSHTGKQVSTAQVNNYMSLQFNSNASGNKALPAGIIAINAQTGQAAVPINSAAAAVNVSSLDGVTTKAQASVALATKLDDLTESIQDPKVLAWAQKITETSHYISGAEGDYAGVEELTVEIKDDKQAYTQANALKDIYTQQLALQKLIDNPPRNANPADVSKVLALANNINANTTPFTDKLDPYLKKDGSIDQGQLSQSHYASNGNDAGKMTGAQYNKLVKYDTLQDKVENVLQDGSASGSLGVQSTLQDTSQLRSNFK